MSLKFSLSVLLLLLVVINASGSREKVIYGEDNRVLSQNSPNSDYREWSKATAALISNYNIRFPKEGSKFPDEVTIFDKHNLASDYGLCESERYSKLINPGICSGFLVEKNGEQFLITAGHCVSNEIACKDYSWVFGFTSDKAPDRYTNRAFLPKNNVYKCVEVVNFSFDEDSQNDYSVLKLDRVVEGVTPLKFRKTGKINSKDELVIIGHPSGLPTIIDDKGSVRENTNDFFFVANLDSFGGNSGSAVLNATTGEVEGILVRGEDDYTYAKKLNKEQKCGTVVTCEEGKCRGEDVTRITNLEFLTGKPGPIFSKPIKK